VTSSQISVGIGNDKWTGAAVDRETGKQEAL